MRPRRDEETIEQYHEECLRQKLITKIKLKGVNLATFSLEEKAYNRRELRSDMQCAKGTYPKAKKWRRNLSLPSRVELNGQPIKDESEE